MRDRSRRNLRESNTRASSVHSDVLLALAAGVLAVAAFGGSLRGDFVYDDRKQILENHLIQDPRYVLQALRSDVWAFKGQQDEAWSNYWRPAFVLWLIANHRLFGVGSSFGWHLANVLLHAAVVLLAYGLLRQLGVARLLAFTIAALFAVHPAHVESVAWISGAPDLLLAAGLLGSFCLVVSALRRSTPLKWTCAAGLFAVALLAKEAGVVFPLLVFAAALEIPESSGHSTGQRLRRAAAAALPFAVIALVFFMVRWRLLGRLEIETPWKLGAFELVLNVPMLLCFYLRQALFPLWLGPSYPLRAVTLETLGGVNFWIPSLLVLAAGWLLWMVRKRPGVTLGLALFLLPLLPVFNINAFIQEQLTHDRYLYLPLLGLLLALFSAAGPVSVGGQGRSTEAAAAWVGLILCLPLLLQTWRYNSAWSSELALWEWGVGADPTSAFNHAQYGHALLEAGRLDSAQAALNRALQIRPVTSALLDRARIARVQGRLGAAENDLRLILADQPRNSIAYEQLARVYQLQGRIGAAIALLETARVQVPYHRCAFSSNLAVLFYLAGDKSRALAELEAARPLVGAEQSTACQLVPFHLSSLLMEMGRRAEARSALEQYLEVSARARDPDNQRARAVARQRLRLLAPG